MTCSAINDLIVSAESSGYENFWEYDGEFFMLFFNKFRHMLVVDIPVIAFMYMEINNWHGMSVRCGVWQYYESGAFEKEKFEWVWSFLRTNGELLKRKFANRIEIVRGGSVAVEAVSMSER